MPSAAPRRSRCSRTASSTTRVGRVDGERSSRPVDLVTGPGQHLRRRRQAPAQGRSSASTPRPGPTEIAILADDSADPDHVAADLVSQAEHDPLAAVGARHRQRGARRGGRRPLARRVPATKHSERVTAALDGHAVAHRPRRRRRRRASTSSTPMPPSTSRSRPATPPTSPPGCATPVPSSSGRTARSASATTPPAPTTCCPPPAAPATAAACRCSPSSAASTSSTTTSAALREVARHVVDAGPGRGPPGPRRGRHGALRRRGAPVTATRAPAARRGAAPAAARPARPHAVRRAAARRAGAAQHQRELLPGAARSSSTPSSRRSPRTWPSLNRYPDREFTDLRKALTAYLEKQSGVTVTPEQVWAANGSNEVLSHVVQAFGGHGRVALGLHAELLDAPDHHARRTARRGSTGCVPPQPIPTRST